MPVITYTAEEVPFHGRLLQITCDVRYRLSAGSPGCHTLPNGDPGYPPDPPEIDSVSFWPHKVVGTGEWSNIAVSSYRGELQAALNAWYASRENYDLDDLMIDNGDDDEPDGYDPTPEE